MYVVLPFLVWLATKIKKKTLLTISVIVFSIFMIDEIYNGFIARIFDLPTANSLYDSWGWKIR